MARALAVDPEFIVADEPVSALDVSIQAQVINLMRRLQEERGLTYLFISHDLSVVKYISDRVGVMYLGVLSSSRQRRAVQQPAHPYTQALLSAVPVPDPDEHERERIVLEGDAKPREPPFRLPFPYPLPLCDGRLRPGRPRVARRVTSTGSSPVTASRGPPTHQL